MTLDLRLPHIALSVIAIHAALIFWMALVVPKPLVLAAKPRVVVHTISLRPMRATSAKAPSTQLVGLTAPDAFSLPTIESMPRLEPSTVQAAKVEPAPQLQKKPATARKLEKKPAKVEIKPMRRLPKKTAATRSKTPFPKPKNQSQRAKNQELLAKAQESIAKIRPAGVKIDATAKGKAADLQIPQLTLATIATDDTALWSAGELSYRDELAGRLKLLLKLSEYGTVSLKLTLKRSGSVAKLAIVTAASKQNRSYVEKILPTLQFPPFGDQFGQEAEHTFTIVLNNDL